MAFNPLDDKGYLKIREGDRVSVTGMMDYDMFEGRELVAKSLVVRTKAENRGTSSS